MGARRAEGQEGPSQEWAQERASCGRLGPLARFSRTLAPSSSFVSAAAFVKVCCVCERERESVCVCVCTRGP